MLFSDPVIKTSVLAAAEQALNDLLALDPVTVDRLSHLAGVVIEIRCIEPALSCFARLENRHVRLVGYNEGTVDVILTGSATCLALLARSRKDQSSDIEGLSITGQPELIEKLQHIHNDMELDWERLIIQMFGETPGHILAQSARLFGRQIHHGRSMFDQNITGYLQEELYLIPCRTEIDHFSDQVKQLQMSLTRLSAKINQNFPSESDSSEA